MPEIGECYSIATAIPNLGKLKGGSFSKNAHNIMRRKGVTAKDLKDANFVKTEAFGKSILFYIEYPNISKKAILCSQLGMTGSWFLNDVQKDRGHNHLVLKFDNVVLRYSDPRMFGKMEIYYGESFDEIKQSIIQDHKWGIDPNLIKDNNELIEAVNKICKSAKMIKVLLLEQNIIFGIGNYLASEILFHAKINPKTSAKTLNEDQRLKLVDSILFTIKLAIKHHGHSFAGGYIRPDGSLGTLSPYIKIYGKSHCPDCSGKVVSEELNGRVTYYCPRCQIK